MHELGLAEEIVRVADREAAHVGATRVLSVGITVGQLMQVEVDCLLFLVAIVGDTSLYTAGAAFEATVEPARLHCADCGATWDMGDWVFLCGTCGSTEVRALSGERLEVTTMEVELDGDGPRTGGSDRR